MANIVPVGGGQIRFVIYLFPVNGGNLYRAPHLMLAKKEKATRQRTKLPLFHTRDLTGWRLRSLFAHGLRCGGVNH